MSASDEVDNAVGTATPSSKQVLLEKKKALEEARGRHAIAREMRDEQAMGVESGIIYALREIISSIETELVSTREVEGVRKAKDRLLGIRRAAGSKRGDRERVLNNLVAAAKLVAKAADDVRRVDADYELYELETAALTDRFGLDRSVLPGLSPSGTTAESLEADALIRNATLPEHRWPTTPPTEECEFKMRTRRTYAEAAGTPGAAIIESAGLKPFPELTERQKDIISAREHEQEQMRRQFAGLPKIPQGGSVPLGSL